MTRQRAVTPRYTTPDGRSVSSARSVASSRMRRVQEINRGNQHALRHGVFATIANDRDVAIEVALIYAARPALDPIRDRRLVEALALSNVQRQRAFLAMQRDGFTAQLTAYESRTAALVERQERAVHEREQERLREQRTDSKVRDLSAYRPKGPPAA